MKITTFWVVTKPTPVSVLEDILFQVNAESLARQFAGGLSPDEIHAFYAGHNAALEARTAAVWLLGKCKKGEL